MYREQYEEYEYWYYGVKGLMRDSEVILKTEEVRWSKS